MKERIAIFLAEASLYFVLFLLLMIIALLIGVGWIPPCAIAFC